MLVRVIPNKTKIAKLLGLSRQSLYYEPIKEEKDKFDKKIIRKVMKNNPAYGHKRIALELKWGKNKTKRLMKKFNLKPARRRIQKQPTKIDDLNFNQIDYFNIYHQYQELNQIDEFNILWRGDFTYIKYQNKFIYKATIIEVCNREVIRIALSNYHDSNLVTIALENALVNHNSSLFFHSDQGSEYRSEKYSILLNKFNITQSFSDKSSPWQNGQQESFFSHFKLEFGDFNKFNSKGKLFAQIYQMVYYYNNERVHTALKMSLISYRKKLLKIKK